MSYFSKFKIGSTSYDVKDALAGKSLSLSGADLSLKNSAGTAVSTVTLPVGGQPKVVKFDGTRFVMKADTSVNIENGVSVGDLIIIDCTQKWIDMSQTGSSSNHLELYLNKNVGTTYNANNSYTNKTNMQKYKSISKSLMAVVTDITGGIVFATVMSQPMGKKSTYKVENLASAPSLDSIKDYLKAYGNVIGESENALNVTLYDNRDSENPVAITPLNKFYTTYDDNTTALILTYDSTYNGIQGKISVPNTYANRMLVTAIAGYMGSPTSNKATYTIYKAYGDLYTGKLFNNYLYVFFKTL